MVSKSLTIFSSPDADDIFMMYGLMTGAITHSEFEFKVELGDIEQLNQRALAKELEVSAVSAHALAYLSPDYDVLCSGMSFAGRDYGPILVKNKDDSRELIDMASIAIPGELTSATLALRIYLAEQDLSPELIPVPFHNVHEAILSGDVDAGILIHEGQIVHERQGLVGILNLGSWWWETRGLNLPLGVIAIKKSLGLEREKIISGCVKQSIQYAQDHRSDALNFAKGYRRGLSLAELDRYVNMYANDTSVDIGQSERDSIEQFLTGAYQCGLLDSAPTINFISG